MVGAGSTWLNAQARLSLTIPPLAQPAPKEPKTHIRKIVEENRHASPQRLQEATTTVPLPATPKEAQNRSRLGRRKGWSRAGQVDACASHACNRM